MIKNLKELIQYKELIYAFTLREIKVRYKQTILGASWAILQPFALTVIFTVVFSVFLKVDSGLVPYPIFAYSALLPWTFFATSVNFGSLSIVNNSSLVTKIFFPRETLPISAIAAAFIDFLIAGVIFLLMAIYYNIEITSNIFLLWIIIPAIIIFTLGITLMLSALNVIFRDIKFVVPLLLQIWLYTSPVIYSVNQVPERLRIIYNINPMAPLLESFRNVTVNGTSPNFTELFFATVISILMFVFGYVFFKSKEKIFADVI